MKRAILLIVFWVLTGFSLSAQSLLTAPVLLTPSTEDSLASPYPTFSWTPVGGSTTLRYAFRLTELLPFQSPTVALQANPVWFEVSGLTTTVLLYPVTAPALQPGKSYAWQVIATDEKDGNTYLVASEGGAFSRKTEKLPPPPQKKKKDKQEKIRTFTETEETVQYYLLQRTLFTNVYEVTTDKIGFHLYETAAVDTTRPLPFVIYEQVPSEPISLSPQPANAQQGTGAYELNISGLPMDKTYTVAVTDGRGRQYFLKFRRKGGVPY